MKVHQIQVGNMQNFSYIVEDEDTSDAIIIDPSWELVELEMIIKENNLKIKYIVNTHHHFDHTLGNEAMVESTKAPLIQHESSELKHDITVKDGDLIKFGNSELKVLHTPGHSQDSICLIGDGKIFSGDTLFVGNGALVYRSLIVRQLASRAHFAPDFLNLPRAGAAAVLALSEWQAGRTFSPDEMMPSYLRPSEAELNLATKKK